MAVLAMSLRVIPAACQLGIRCHAMHGAARRYSGADVHVCRYLQMGLGMEVDPAKPLVVCVTRLVPQKGIHLIRHGIFRTLEQGGQFVLLGSGHADGEFR